MPIADELGGDGEQEARSLRQHRRDPLQRRFDENATAPEPG
ncbi:hypothetical protein ACFQ07_02510 [Actinomadura adrarensis]|uniref:Uncharacterized protein n=1 Tax=Actinomadura adrarensis TaxID=1819600 RepID=A0ABW3C9W7_9ACTN